ncbi:MAG: hypothetical protein CMG82_00005 [Marinobacter sp.]|jgi:hypothetical protein|nr:hypothetical protein [Marinobacter sp.]
MRRNLTEMMDFIGLQRWLGLKSCGDLFQTRQDLVHFTSALRNPVLDQGNNFSGGRAMISSSYLWDQIQTGLVTEIKSLPEDCVFIPLGQGVDAVFEKLASEGCSGSMIPDTNVGGKIATISEVSDDQKTTFLYS